MVLSGLRLSVPTGECLALVGPTGVGKTTLLRLIAGLEQADSGSVTLNGHVVCDGTVFVAPHQRKVGLVFQDLALWPHLKAWENVEFMLPAGTRGRSERRAHAMDLLAQFSLRDRHDCRPHELSRGQQQRVALARAVASEPSLLLLDECLSSQDGESKSQMLALLHEYHSRTKLTSVFVTHSVHELPDLAQRVAVLGEGVIKELLPTAEFLAGHAHL